MTSDVSTVLWKELSENLARRAKGSGPPGARPQAVMSAGFGAFFAWQIGPAWAGLPAIAMASMQAALAVMNTVPDSFAGERDRKTLEALLTSRLSDRSILLGKLAAAAVLGIAAGALVLVAGLISVNVKPHSGGVILYSPLDVVAAVGAAALVATVLGNVGVLASLRASSVMAAQRGMVLGIVGVGAAVAALGSALPQGWTTELERLAEEAGTDSPALLVAVGLAVLISLNLALFTLSKRLFRRPRLVGA